MELLEKINYESKQTNSELLKNLRGAERRRIGREVLLEQEWWGSRILPNEEEAIVDSDLIIVPDEGTNYRLISKLRQLREPKTLNPLAFKLLLEIQKKMA